VQLSSLSLGVEGVAEKGDIGWLTMRRRVAELEVLVEKRVPVSQSPARNRESSCPPRGMIESIGTNMICRRLL